MLKLLNISTKFKRRYGICMSEIYHKYQSSNIIIPNNSNGFKMGSGYLLNTDNYVCILRTCYLINAKRMEKIKSERN